MSNKRECPYCNKMIVKLNDHIKRIHPQTPEDIEFKLKENERCLNYARNNRDVLNKCNANWRKNNPEQYKASCKKWNENNQERMKQYRIDNKEQIFIVSKKNRSQRINCVDCGVEISKGYLSQHKKFCCKDPESIQRKMKEKEEKVIRDETNSIIRGKKPKKKYKPRGTEPEIKPLSEMDKLRLKIKRAEKAKEIKKNLLIKNDVLLEF